MVGADSVADLAVLKVDASGLAAATSSQSTSAENIGFAIAIDTAKPVVAGMMGTTVAALTST